MSKLSSNTQEEQHVPVHPKLTNLKLGQNLHKEKSFRSLSVEPKKVKASVIEQENLPKGSSNESPNTISPTSPNHKENKEKAPVLSQDNIFNYRAYFKKNYLE